MRSASTNVFRSGSGGDHPESRHYCRHAHPDSRARFVRTSFGLFALAARGNFSERLANCARYQQGSRGAAGTTLRAGRFQPCRSALDRGATRVEIRTEGGMGSTGTRPAVSKDVPRCDKECLHRSKNRWRARALPGLLLLLNFCFRGAVRYDSMVRNLDATLGPAARPQALDAI